MHVRQGPVRSALVALISLACTTMLAHGLHGSMVRQGLSGFITPCFGGARRAITYSRRVSVASMSTDNGAQDGAKQVSNPQKICQHHVPPSSSKVALIVALIDGQRMLTHLSIIDRSPL